jgi:caffeoyl-CoA O-methyltransferase
MDIINEALQQYSEQHTTPENDLLRSINRNTHANVLRPRMLSGHLQGRVLAIFSQMLRPLNILEIGTYTGYSALCMAEGLREGGKLITIDVNEELEQMVRSSFSSSPHNSRIDFRIGDARAIIPTLSETFDLVFIDADKENYSLYFDLVFDKVSPGGIILADNVLWSGKVIDARPDKDTVAIQEFNRKIHEDKRVENVLLPIRDGIMMIRKLSL